MSKVKNIVLKILPVCIVLVLGIPETMATHIVGGDLTYRCLGGDQYEVTLTVRRDCDGGDPEAQFDDPASIGIFDIFGSLQLHLGEFGQLRIPFIKDDTISNELTYDCSQLGGLVCVHETVYKDTVSLPYNKMGYILAYQRCCRNSILNNIVEPLETGATYFVRIPEKILNACNSSPVFNNWPDVYICANQDLVFDHSATDPDGDVLVYSLCTPSLGATEPHPMPQPPGNPPYGTVSWLTPYSLNNLMGGVPVSIDPNTGVLTANPNTVGTFLVGICVEEYRNGELIGTVRRDFEYNVRICGDPVTVDFDVTQGECDPNVAFENLTIGADSYEWFFDWPNDDPSITSTEVNPTHTYAGNGTYTVRLYATRNSDGCTAIKEKEITISTVPLTADFEASPENCDSSDVIVLTDTSVDPSGLTVATAWEWTVILDSGTTVLNENPATIDIGDTENAEITLVVTSNANCTSTVTKSFDRGDLIPEADFKVMVLSCTADGYNIELSNTSQSAGAAILSTEWLILDDGIPATLSGDPVAYLASDGPLSITMTSQLDNGCEISLTRDYGPGGLLPEVNINSDAPDCITAFEAEVNFSADFDMTCIAGAPETYVWTVISNGDTTLFNTETIQLTINAQQAVQIFVEIVLDNGCVLTTSDMVMLDFAPELDIDEEVDCTGNPIVITLTDETVLSPGVSVVSYSWTGGGATGNTSSFTVDLLNTDTEVTLDVVYSNGCTSRYAKIFDFNEYTPNVDFDAAYAFCEGNTGVFTFSDTSTYPDSFNLIDLLWTFDTLNLSGSQVEVELTLDDTVSVSLTAVFDNGCNRTIERDVIVRDLLDTISIEVITLDDLSTCGDTINLEIANPNPNVVYHWSTDIDFTNIIGTGTQLHYRSDASYTGVVFVEVVEVDSVCVYGFAQYDVPDNSISLEIFEPFEVCPGDTAKFGGIINAAADQILTFQWSDPHIVSGADTICPVIGVGIDETEDFEAAFSVVNQYGCTLDDTVSFTIGGNEQLTFIAELDSCGSFTMNFSSPTDLDIYVWEFGDPGSPDNTSSDPTPSHTYPASGTYTVTLSEISAFCQGLPAVMDVIVPEPVFVEIDPDTLGYNAGDTLTLTASTNVAGENVLWCLENGTVLGSGNPFDYTPQADVLLLAKVTDTYGCSDTASIFLFEVPDTMISNAFILTPEAICSGDTVQLDLQFDQISDPGFTYLWAPEECIVSGIDTPNPFVTATETKIFTVSIRNTALGIDTMLTTELIVNNPSVQIELVDAQGNPDDFIFAGEEGYLQIANPDPNCTYAWSTGDTGSQITISPDTTTSYSVTCTDNLGCTASDVIEVEVRPITMITNAFILTPDAICIGDTVQLEVQFDQIADGGYTYLWDPAECIVSGIDTPNPIVTATETKTFTVSIRNVTLDIDTMLTTTLTVNNPSVQIMLVDDQGNPDDYICLGEDGFLQIANPDPNCTYEWSTGDIGDQITISPETNTTYSVTCTDDLGCTASDQYDLEVRQPECNENDVFLPNAFSPNGDNINDVLYVRSKFIDEMELLIYNRWGQEVFRSTDQSVGWDGTFEGETLPPDAYAYSLVVICINQVQYQTQGNVSIIK